MEGLSDMSQRHPFVADERLAQMGYRKLPVKNYIVFFSIDEKTKWLTLKEACMAGGTG